MGEEDDEESISSEYDDDDKEEDDDESITGEVEVYGPSKGTKGNSGKEDSTEYVDEGEDYEEDDDEYEDDDDDYESDDSAEESNDEKSRKPSGRVVFKPHNKRLNENKENIMYS